MKKKGCIALGICLLIIYFSIRAEAGVSYLGLTHWQEQMTDTKDRLEEIKRLIEKKEFLLKTGIGEQEELETLYETEKILEKELELLKAENPYDFTEVKREVMEDYIKKIEESYENLASAGETYLNLKKSVEEEEQALEKKNMQHTLGQISAGEFDAARMRYENLWLERLEALQQYNKLLESFNQLIYGSEESGSAENDDTESGSAESSAAQSDGAASGPAESP